MPGIDDSPGVPVPVLLVLGFAAGLAEMEAETLAAAEEVGAFLARRGRPL